MWLLTPPITHPPYESYMYNICIHCGELNYYCAEKLALALVHVRVCMSTCSYVYVGMTINKMKAKVKTLNFIYIYRLPRIHSIFTLAATYWKAWRSMLKQGRVIQCCA